MRTRHDEYHRRIWEGVLPFAGYIARIGAGVHHANIAAGNASERPFSMIPLRQEGWVPLSIVVWSDNLDREAEARLYAAMVCVEGEIPERTRDTFCHARVQAFCMQQLGDRRNRAQQRRGQQLFELIASCRPLLSVADRAPILELEEHRKERRRREGIHRASPGLRVRPRSHDTCQLLMIDDAQERAHIAPRGGVTASTLSPPPQVDDHLPGGVDPPPPQVDDHPSGGSRPSP